MQGPYVHLQGGIVQKVFKFERGCGLWAVAASFEP